MREGILWSLRLATVDGGQHPLEKERVEKLTGVSLLHTCTNTQICRWYPKLSKASHGNSPPTRPISSTGLGVYCQTFYCQTWYASPNFKSIVKLYLHCQNFRCIVKLYMHCQALYASSNFICIIRLYRHRQTLYKMIDKMALLCSNIPVFNTLSDLLTDLMRSVRKHFIKRIAIDPVLGLSLHRNRWLGKWIHSTDCKHPLTVSQTSSDATSIQTTNTLPRLTRKPISWLH